MHLALISASFLSVIVKLAAESVGSVCDIPPDIRFASLTEKSVDTYPIGSSVTYECQFGYVASGKSRNLKCKRYGYEARWTEPQFTCIPQSCGDPGYVTNARRAGSLFTFPNSVTYHCEEGYKLRGIATRYCQTSGTWSGRLPVCEVITCETPKNPENGHVTASSYEYGSELHYECDKGFSLNTDETVYCTEDGAWSKSDVTCLETVCEIPEKPEFGYVHFRGSGERPRAGSIAIFSCEDGRIVDGPTSSKCLENGKWNFSPPKCLEPCSIQYISNGEIGKNVWGRWSTNYRKMNVGDRVEEDEELLLRCNERFEIAGSSYREMKVFCTKGKWSREILCNPASCRSKVPSATNAEVVEVNREHDGTVLYDCFVDYKKMSEETVICNHGAWMGRPPTCESTKCSVDILKSPGLLKGWKNSYRDGEELEVTCDARYQLDSENSGPIMCQGGKWSGNLSPCVPAKCLNLPPSIEHGRVTNPSKTSHGSIARYECDHPYNPVGSSLVQCAFGQWIGEPPQCQDSRCYLDDLRNLQHVSRESQSATFSGDRLNIICNEGYSPKSKMPLCQNGVWHSDYEPLCEESGCLVPKIRKGSVKEQELGDSLWNWKKFRWEKTMNFRTIPPETLVGSGRELWFTCDRPYSVNGKGMDKDRVFCLKGKWSTYLQCLRDGERPVSSTATSILQRSTPVPKHSRSTSAITVEYLPSSTTPNPAYLGVAATVNIDEERTVAVVTSHPPTEPPAEECFCEYPIDDRNIVAHSDGNRLIYGDRVRNGSKVIFHCAHVGYHRFRGHREITCSDCQPWHSNDFPTCIAPQKGDAAIVFNRDVNVLEDGSIEIRKGQSVNLTCVAMEIAEYPEWRAPEAPGISVISERREREDYSDIVYLTHLEIHTADDKMEGAYECSINGLNEITLQVVIKDPSLRCPEFPEDDGIIIEYQMERRVNSKVSFICPKKGQEIIGKPILTCLRNGQWSDPPPTCSGVRCKVLKTNDLLQIDYSGDREVDSLVAFHCPIPGKRSGVSLTRCLQNGKWKDPTPTCRIPDCSLEDLLPLVPQNAVPLVDNEKHSSLPYNSAVKLACADGKVAVGNPEAKCGEEAKWNIDTVQCASGCQPPIKLPASRLILNPDKDIYKIGERVTLACPPGMILNKESQVIMCITNGWSELVLPECKEKE